MAARVQHGQCQLSRMISPSGLLIVCIMFLVGSLGCAATCGILCLFWSFRRNRTCLLDIYRVATPQGCKSGTLTGEHLAMPMSPTGCCEVRERGSVPTHLRAPNKARHPSLRCGLKRSRLSLIALWVKELTANIFHDVARARKCLFCQEIGREEHLFVYDDASWGSGLKPSRRVRFSWFPGRI